MEGRAWPVGVLTSDPRIVEGAAPVPLLTYEEATELAFFGATVLHPLAMQPALQSRSLAVRVKNSYNRRALTLCNSYNSTVWGSLTVCMGIVVLQARPVCQAQDALSGRCEH